LHNIAFYLRLMRDARSAIAEKRYASFAASRIALLRGDVIPPSPLEGEGRLERNERREEG